MLHAAFFRTFRTHIAAAGFLVVASPDSPDDQPVSEVHWFTNATRVQGEGCSSTNTIVCGCQLHTLQDHSALLPAELRFISNPMPESFYRHFQRMLILRPAEGGDAVAAGISRKQRVPSPHALGDLPAELCLFFLLLSAFALVLHFCILYFSDISDAGEDCYPCSLFCHPALLAFAVRLAGRQTGSIQTNHLSNQNQLSVASALALT